ncbi:hypothetical protein [Sapientia aquatica]|uniref:DUF2570 domain-containing protein n=1 Tax=Sapientia aquatica TaxID=1549640 RepID=A0A4R5W1L8_9BURK|nr:hypothetical protein [Sapientia aquatica]TDK65993.1 hypothetical protein E2I14_10395 [Sapientia aquatica]
MSKTFWITIAAALIVFCLGAGAGWVAGSIDGRAVGRQLERADQSSKTITDITAIVDAHKKLIADANAASRAMRAALAARSATDDDATKELTNALTQTAANRVDCRFDDNVMRQLNAARDRAATSSASGIRYPLSNATSASQ